MLKVGAPITIEHRQLEANCFGKIIFSILAIENHEFKKKRFLDKASNFYEFSKRTP